MLCKNMNNNKASPFFFLCQQSFLVCHQNCHLSYVSHSYVLFCFLKMLFLLLLLLLWLIWPRTQTERDSQQDNKKKRVPDGFRIIPGNPRYLTDKLIDSSVFVLKRLTSIRDGDQPHTLITTHLSAGWFL